MPYPFLNQVDQRVIQCGVNLPGLAFAGWRIPAGYRVKSVTLVMVAVTSAQEAFARIAAGTDELPTTDVQFQALRRQFVSWRFDIGSPTGDFFLPLGSPVTHQYELDYYCGSQQVIVVEYRFTVAGSMTMILDAQPGRAPKVVS
jgi:hypothetical protein